MRESKGGRQSVVGGRIEELRIIMKESKGRGNRRDSDAVRTFICIEIPQAIKERIGELQRDLRGMDARISWVKPENIHLTLKFLGDVSQSRIESVKRAAERVAGSSSMFEIEAGGAGCFPSLRNPRVLWVGLSHLPDELKRLHSKIEDELAREGFPREQKKFSPHLTIGRIRSPQNASLVAEKLIAAGFEPVRFQADEIIVMRSDLNPSGSIYTPQAVMKLGHHAGQAKSE